MDSAFNYFSKNGAISESDYPYTAKDGTCAYNAAKVVANTKIASWVDVTS
jgi:hypothetical protein